MKDCMELRLEESLCIQFNYIRQSSLMVGLLNFFVFLFFSTLHRHVNSLISDEKEELRFIECHLMIMST